MWRPGDPLYDETVQASAYCPACGTSWDSPVDVCPTCDRSQPAEPAKVDASGSQRSSTENPLAEEPT